MPCQGASLVFNKGTLRAFSVVRKDLYHIILPTHVKLLGQIDPFFAVGLLCETAVLGTHTKTLDTTKPFVQSSLIAA